MHWTTTDEGQVTMAGVASGILRERKEKGKGTLREREGKSIVERKKRERKRRAFLSIHT
ncbi:hypothetical protein E5676_scaffold344G00760 [Cucumis melo var. makuwa]|uniref:Uncharacterized protein n=1 Tax=Cucumis melo var. makuwa TaxID=1194695 RepID=A0A5D3E3D9_CUCMM|nr:hypothetical protein E6C27_scaffold56G00250 [Cucumis melo var. makuwa]TYK30309.1 hypothetical protein E5676_scaffold344G00760 [Cucumis melo var. makuwa]